MGLFDQKSKEAPLYKNNYLGSVIEVYENRVEFSFGTGKQSIPINQIASIQLGFMGLMQITLETTGGKKYKIATLKKQEVQKAIYDAQNKAQTNPTSQISISEELEKLHTLKEKNIISEEEYKKLKEKLLT